MGHIRGLGALMFPISVAILLFRGISLLLSSQHTRVYTALFGLAFVAAGEWLPDVMNYPLRSAEGLWNAMWACPAKDEATTNFILCVAQQCADGIERWYETLRSSREQSEGVSALQMGLVFAAIIGLMLIPIIHKCVKVAISLSLTGLVMLAIFELILVSLYGRCELYPADLPGRLVDYLDVTRFKKDYRDVVYPQVTMLLYLTWYIIDCIRQGCRILWEDLHGHWPDHRNE